MDQSPSRGIGRQKTATVIFNRQCPKVVDRFRFGNPENCPFVISSNARLAIFESGSILFHESDKLLYGSGYHYLCKVSAIKCLLFEYQN